MYVKRIAVIILLVMNASLFAGGMPEYVINGNGDIVPNKEVLVFDKAHFANEKPIKFKQALPISSYQRLKKKYELEVEYSNELKDRIFKLEGELYKDQTPIIKPVTKDGSIVNYIAVGIIGIIIGALVW